MTTQYNELKISNRLQNVFTWFTYIGIATFLIGLLFETQRTLSSFLLINMGLLGMGLGAALFIALQYVCSAHWAVVIRRVPEAMCSVIPWASAGIIITLIIGKSLYPWTHDDAHIMGMKGILLSYPFVLGRSIVILTVWTLLIRAIVQRSRQQDTTADAALSASNKKLSAIFLVVFGLTFWIACFDWIMSLEPEWYSTMYGVYHFAGLFLGSLAAMTVLVVWLRQLGPLQGIVTQEHLHDLGKMLFAFSTFWMYIWFSEYMLIWYANFPEETGHYIRRLSGGWGPLFVANMCVTWLLPFFILLPKPVKRDPGMLVKVSCLILFGRWLDLYILIYPSAVGHESVAFGIWELGQAFGALGIFMLIFLRAFKATAPVPLADPLIQASLNHYQ